MLLVLFIWWGSKLDCYALSIYLQSWIVYLCCNRLRSNGMHHWQNRKIISSIKAPIGGIISASIDFEIHNPSDWSIHSKFQVEPRLWRAAARPGQVSARPPRGLRPGPGGQDLHGGGRGADRSVPNGIIYLWAMNTFPLHLW